MEYANKVYEAYKHVVWTKKGYSIYRIEIENKLMSLDILNSNFMKSIIVFLFIPIIIILLTSLHILREVVAV